jgi:hypothetical protein
MLIVVGLISMNYMELITKNKFNILNEPPKDIVNNVENTLKSSQSNPGIHPSDFIASI